MSRIQKKKTRKQAAADTPPAVPMLEPEQVVDQLRTLRSQIAEVSPLTPEQRRVLRQQAALPDSVISASINVIGASDTITSAVGAPAGGVRVMVADADRWDAVENELKATLAGVAGANLIRRQKIAVIAAQAYGIGKQLARVPQNADLVPHVAEVKHQRTLARRKKRATQTPGTPAPAPGTPTVPVNPQATETTPAADTSMTAKA
jgi:hypothetical protein